MRTTQQLSITLPNEMADAVKAKVQAGEYATESEVIRDGLRALRALSRRNSCAPVLLKNSPRPGEPRARILTRISRTARSALCLYCSCFHAGHRSPLHRGDHQLLREPASFSVSRDDAR
jgi:putative addiction module CopG family antidote